MIENEITHLIARMPDLDGLKRAEIEQHYISASPEPLRIRSVDGKRFELTKKLTVDPNDKSRKREINIPIDAAEFADLKTLSKRSVLKTRHYLPLDGGRMAEIDVFHGPLEGLHWVEVEFPDDATRAAFVPPDWFGRDVSQEKWASNSRIAGLRFADIAGHLDAPNK